MMKNLETCEQVLGQMVNKRKSNFLIYTNSLDLFIKYIMLITDISHYLFPFTYLGHPVYLVRNKVCYFSNMFSKIRNRTRGWQHKLLSVGDRLVRIRSVAT